MRAQYRADAAALDFAVVAGELRGQTGRGLIRQETVNQDLPADVSAESAQLAPLLHAPARQGR